MTERIDNLKYTESPPGTDIFLDGPAEFLVASCVAELLKDKFWKQIFGDFMDPYKRMDYPERCLPALRMYNDGGVKQYESWFIEGDMRIDLIMPGSIRRKEVQQFQDSLASAMLQQFRRDPFFDAVCALVPGLNELGKTFSWDKALGFQSNDQAAIVPMTQITVNFRIDLRQWDTYLETSGRTKEDPFEVTLRNLARISTEIQGLNDSGGIEVTVPLDQKTT